MVVTSIALWFCGRGVRLETAIAELVKLDPAFGHVSFEVFEHDNVAATLVTGELLDELEERYDTMVPWGAAASRCCQVPVLAIYSISPGSVHIHAFDAQGSAKWDAGASYGDDVELEPFRKLMAEVGLPLIHEEGGPPTVPFGQRLLPEGPWKQIAEVSDGEVYQTKQLAPVVEQPLPPPLSEVVAEALQRSQPGVLQVNAHGYSYVTANLLDEILSALATRNDVQRIELEAFELAKPEYWVPPVLAFLKRLPKNVQTVVLGANVAFPRIAGRFGQAQLEPLHGDRDSVSWWTECVGRLRGSIDTFAVSEPSRELTQVAERLEVALERGNWLTGAQPQAASEVLSWLKE